MKFYIFSRNKSKFLSSETSKSILIDIFSIAYRALLILAPSMWTWIMHHFFFLAEKCPLAKILLSVLSVVSQMCSNDIYICLQSPHIFTCQVNTELYIFFSLVSSLLCAIYNTIVSVASCQTKIYTQFSRRNFTNRNCAKNYIINN